MTLESIVILAVLAVSEVAWAIYLKRRTVRAVRKVKMLAQLGVY